MLICRSLHLKIRFSNTDVLYNETDNIRKHKPIQRFKMRNIHNAAAKPVRWQKGDRTNFCNAN